MSSKLPDFANELFDKIARENGFRDFSVEINSGSQPGDGFTSEMFRVKITENKSSKKLELVCKMAPTNENRRKEFLSDKIFRREALFYQHLMPMLANFQEERKLSEEDQFRSYPKCYGAKVDDKKDQYIIVLEDLRPLNFKMWDKSKPTTIENARITMRELGKFHGLSIAFNDQNPTEFSEFKQLKTHRTAFLESSSTSFIFENSYVKAVESLESADHKSIMRLIKDNYLKFFSNCLDEEALERVGVYCHGDCWNNNLMFRFDENGAAEEIRFLDWQISHYGSPAIDIVYNLFTSTDKALRDKEYNNLIKLYYESLSKTVKLLGSDPEKIFKYEDFLSELKRCGVYALLMAPLLLQISQADSSEIPNLNEVCDKVVEGEIKIDIVAGLSAKGQLECDRRLNDVFEDVIALGYYQVHQNNDIFVIKI